MVRTLATVALVAIAFAVFWTFSAVVLVEVFGGAPADPDDEPMFLTVVSAAAVVPGAFLTWIAWIASEGGCDARVE